MKNKILSFILILTVVFTSCTPAQEIEIREKQSFFMLNAFDTLISLVSYQDEETFSEMTQYLEEEFYRLHELYDIYNNYEGVNNIKTINDNAGIMPVEVDEDIISLLIFSKEWHEKSNGNLNIALGSVLTIWHDTRTFHSNNGSVELPLIEDLEKANEYAKMDNIIIDEENNTVFITDENTQLDVGGVAKGYATELISTNLQQTYDNFALSAGGNIRIYGQPFDGERTRWAIGIQNTAVDENFTAIGGTTDIAYANGVMSVVCSGGYQRYFVQDGRRYHHLIDPDTLYPEEYYQGVAILHPDSGVADALSTTIFFMEVDEALNYINSIESAECILVTIDGTTHYSDNAKLYLESFGITSTTP